MSTTFTPGTDRIDDAFTRPSRPSAMGDLVVDAATRQGDDAAGVVRRVDPQAWLFSERSRYLTTGSCDPYAEQMLRAAGFLRD